VTEIETSVAAEALRQDCFLCRPMAALLVDVSQAGYAVAGLGPLTDGYTVVATHDHVQGLAAVPVEARRVYADYTMAIGSQLSKQYGGCFIIEHGNMAVCGVDDATGRAHCLHPHFLLVPDTRCSVDPFLEYFGSEHKSFGSLAEAVQYGADRGQYVLAGEISGTFYVFLPNGDLPRQFARALLAEQLELVDRASWRDTPDPAWTTRNAHAIRGLLRSS
jgi:hypothetical protein